MQTDFHHGLLEADASTTVTPFVITNTAALPPPLGTNELSFELVDFNDPWCRLPLAGAGRLLLISSDGRQGTCRDQHA